MVKIPTRNHPGALWLFKTEPADFSWEDLVRQGATTWDGVANSQALLYLRKVVTQDRVLLYHTGTVRAVVGVARVSRGAYRAPGQADERRVVVDLEPLRPLARPLELLRIKAVPALADFPLVRISRLSIMPVTPVESTHLLSLAGEVRW